MNPTASYYNKINMKNGSIAKILFMKNRVLNTEKLNKSEKLVSRTQKVMQKFRGIPVMPFLKQLLPDQYIIARLGL